MSLSKHRETMCPAGTSHSRNYAGAEQRRKKAFCRTLAKRAHPKQEKENAVSSSVLPSRLLTKLKIMPGCKVEISVRPNTTITGLLRWC